MQEMKRFSCQLLLLFLLQDATFLVSGQPASLDKFVEAAMPSNRIPVAILGFENKAGDTAADWGRMALYGLLVDGMSEVKALHILRDVDFAFRQMDIKDGIAIDPAQAQKLGEIMEARWVIWGSYQRAGDKWRAMARVLNVAMGSSSTELIAAAADWHEVRDRLVDQILRELAIIPAPGEQERTHERWTTSSEAMEYVCKAEIMSMQKSGLAGQEKNIRQAIAADPECGLAYGVLAGILVTRGEMAEADKAARHAVELRPSRYGAHQTLGTVCGLESKHQEAEKELQMAARLDPDEPEVFVRLGETYWSQNMAARAMESFEKALQVDPFSASAHAHLGRGFAVLGDREKAMSELKAAARLASPEDLNAEQFLAEAYDKLSEASLAVDHYEKFISIAKRQGIEPERLKSYQISLDAWKARLVPVYFNLAPPTNYSEQTFAAVLQQKLSREELTLVVNPLTRTLEMDHWAKELTAGATNDVQKAKMLFDGLACHVDVGLRAYGKRTAADVFADWDKPGASFPCMDYALLYVSLARAAGLRTYFVLVQQECDDRKVPHACASVVVGDQILLVDAAYRWFGAPHKQFALLDDVQASAAWLSYQGDLARCQIARKLAPDLTVTQESLFLLLAAANRWDEAGGILPALQRLDKTGVMANFAQGSIAWHNGSLDEAVGFLRKAVELDPDQGEPQLLLGYIYWERFQLRPALECYKDALNCYLRKEDIQNARDTMAVLNVAIDANDRAANSHPETATGFYERAQARWRNGEMEAVLSDYDQALRINPKYFEAYRDRGVLYRERGQFDKAIFDFTEAAQLNGKDYNVFDQRGAIYFVTGQFEEAAADFRKAASLNAKDGYALNQLAWLLATCADASVRNGRAAVEKAKKACELAGWSNKSYIDTYAAACAEAGDFEQAIKFEREAIEMASSEDPDRPVLQQRLTLYEKGLPFRLTPKPPDKT